MRSDFPKIDTERLVLRELTRADAPGIFSIHGDAAAMRWFGSDSMKQQTEAERLIEIFAEWRKLPNPGLRWGIERRDSGTLIGSCGLFKWNRAWSVCTVGYELDKSAWGQGFMREALTAMLNWGMREMNLNRIEAQIYSQNSPSIRLIENLGFRFEGTFRQLGYWENKFHDLDGYSLLRRDWIENEIH
jgi:ribosomal-protein-alanine N-acetyltransferase